MSEGAQAYILGAMYSGMIMFWVGMLVSKFWV